MTTPRPQIDTSRPHSARVYDALLNGKDNYPVDRELVDSLPDFFRDAARQNRRFMHRAVAWAARQGIDQFLDIGTGIPTEPNLHQVVQAITPAARVVYVDHDPIVLRHAEALLVSSPEGATDYIQADVRSTRAILDHARTLLDFDRPIALSLVALMHFITDDDDPYAIVHTLVDALAPGSVLVLSHSDLSVFPDEAEKAAAYTSTIASAFRPRDQVARFFTGLHLVEPGVVAAPQWRPDDDSEAADEPSAVWAGAARKPVLQHAT
jgi:SAM-dependent methyltransferase